MIHHHLVSASYWLLQKAGSGGRGLSEQSQVVCWWVRGSFFIMWGRKKELLNVNSGLMPPGAEMPSLLQVRCRSDGATGRIGRLFFHFGVHSLKRWEVPVSQFVTYRDKKVFMTKETKMDVMSN